MAALAAALASFWQQYSYEAVLTLGAYDSWLELLHLSSFSFTAFWATHLIVRFIVGPMFKVPHFNFISFALIYG